MKIDEFFPESVTGMDWVSPIKLDIVEQFENELEQGIIKGLLKYDISVDIEELKKALSYSKDSYKKGFNDGVDACLHYPHVYYWHDPEKDPPPEGAYLMICTKYAVREQDGWSDKLDIAAGMRQGDRYRAMLNGFDCEIPARDVTAWMHFPRPWVFKE